MDEFLGANEKHIKHHHPIGTKDKIEKSAFHELFVVADERSVASTGENRFVSQQSSILAHSVRPPFPTRCRFFPL